MSVSVTMPRLGESVTEGTVTRWLKHEGDQVEADEPLLEVSTDKVDTEVPSPASGVLTSIKVQEDETVDIGVELAVIGDAAGEDSSAPAVEEGPAEPEPEPEPAQAPPPSEPESAPAAEAEPEPAAPARAEPEVAAEPPEATTAPPAQAPTPAQAPPPAQAPAPLSAAAPSEAAEANADDEEVAGTYVTPLVRRLASENGVDLSTVTGTGVGGRIRKSDVLDAAEQAAEAARDA